MRHRFPLTVFSLALLLFCQGCNHRPSAMPTDNAYHLETDYQDSYRKNSALFYFVDTPEGTAYNGLGRLYMISDDASTLQLSCFRPECQHAFFAGNCMANLYHMDENNFQYMNGKLYYTMLTGDNTTGLFRMDVTGENRELLREDARALLSGNSTLVIHRNFLYVYCVEALSEQQNTLKLYQLDLNNPTAEMKLLWKEDVPGLAMSLCAKLAARGNYLFFRNPNADLYIYAGAAMPPLLYSLDLQTGQVYDCILSDGGIPEDFAIVDDRIFVSVQTSDGHQLLSFSYTFEDAVTFPERASKDAFFLCGDPKYLYVWSIKDPTLYILDKNGQQLDKLDLSFFSESNPMAGLHVSMQESGRVYISSGDMNWGFHYFDKSEIGSGRITLRGLPMVCCSNDYTDPVPMPDDFTWDWDRFYGYP